MWGEGKGVSTSGDATMTEKARVREKGRRERAREGRQIALGHWARLTCVCFSLGLLFTHRLHTIIPFNRDHLTFHFLAFARLLTPQRPQVSPQRMVYVVVVTPIRRSTLSVL